MAQPVAAVDLLRELPDGQMWCRENLLTGNSEEISLQE
jgi:hypothetical protein